MKRLHFILPDGLNHMGHMYARGLAEGVYRLIDEYAKEVGKPYYEVSSYADDPVRNDADVFINFLGRKKRTERHVLERGINFHPAPPEYPGVGVATRALRDGAKQFGVTIHRIAPKLDSGRILLVRRFQIQPFTTCGDLFDQAQSEALSLLPYAISRAKENGTDWPNPPNETWGRYVGEAEFKPMLNLDLDDELLDPWRVSTRLTRFLQTTYNTKKPRPTITVGGHRFKYDDE